jgi:UDP-N-acetylmuramoyl-tripeptide--D-alanyl-D-alanine ligase
MASALHSFGCMKSIGKKIAVLGDMLELGEVSRERHSKIGAMVPEQGVDILITVGPEAFYIAEQAKKKGMQISAVFHVASPEDATRILEEHVDSGDLVLVKASRGVKLDRVVDAIMKFETAKGM